MSADSRPLPSRSEDSAAAPAACGAAPSGAQAQRPGPEPLPLSARDLPAALERIRRAAAVIGPHVLDTPTVYSHPFSELSGREVHLKLEVLQRTGSFKVRGALHRILTLPEDQRARGVIAASAGNHAQGVGLAARLCACPATIVMPVGTPQIKVRRTASYGAEVLLHGPDYEHAYRHALELSRERGLLMVHPFDDPEVIVGQGTIGLEVVRDVPDLETAVVPIGGGGLIAGVALALKALRPNVRIVGVQAAGAAPMVHSFLAGETREVERPMTIADGIRVGKVGGHTWPLVRDLVDECVTVEEAQIVDAIVQGLEQAKVVLEGAGAVALAALLAGRVSGSGKVVLLQCGGNIDLTTLQRVVEMGLARSGRTRRVRLRVVDSPGQLERIGTALREEGVNLLDLQHLRGGSSLPLGQVDLELLVETRGEEGFAALRTRLANFGELQ